MKAGLTDIDVDTRIIITLSADNDSEVIGLTGRITHPFAILMIPKVSYIAGVYLDEQNIVSNNIMNLIKGDEFKAIIEPVSGVKNER